jgi:FkbM family methyltransferase
LELLPGWSVKCHPASRSHFQSFEDDPAQRDELRAFFSHSSTVTKLLDIGAHHGVFTLAALHCGGPTARVVAVEPSTRAAEILKINLQLNNRADRVRVENIALGPTDGELKMLTTGPAGADYLVVPASARSDTTCVPQRSLASFLRETEFQPTHVKMDVESCEYEVLESSVELLAGLKPILFLELHGNMLRARGKDPARVPEMLRAAGYRRFLELGRALDPLELASREQPARLVCLQ